MSLAASLIREKAPALWLPAGAALAAGLGWMVVRYQAADRPMLMLEGLVALATLACVWRWRLGIYAILLYVTVEGVAINATYPRTTTLLFKDVLLAGTYIGFALAVASGRWKLIIPAGFAWPLGALAGLCAAQALNPSGVPIPVTLVGFRVLLFYTPLYLLGIALARDRDVLVRLLRLVLYASIPITLFGIIEWLVGPGLARDLGPGFSRSVWIIGWEALPQMIYRPSSTFTFVGHYGAYLFFIALVGFAALHRPMSLRERVLMTGAFLAAMVAVVVEAQRTTWILLPLGAFGTYVLVRNGRAILRAFPVVAGGIALAVMVGGPVLSNRLPILTSGLGAFRDRLYGTTGGAFQYANYTNLEAFIGHGTGTALGAVRYVTGGVVPSAFETGWFTPFYMFGYLGLLVFVWLYAAVLYQVWRGIQTIPSDERWPATAVFWFLALTAALNGPITYPPTNIYFWLFAGVVAGVFYHPGLIPAPTAKGQGGG
jgi:hypothetical protein